MLDLPHVWTEAEARRSQPARATQATPAKYFRLHTPERTPEQANEGEGVMPLILLKFLSNSFCIIQDFSFTFYPPGYLAWNNTSRLMHYAASAAAWEEKAEREITQPAQLAASSSSSLHQGSGREASCCRSIRRH